MKKHIKRALLLFLFVLIGHTGLSDEVRVVAPDGAWTWFNEPVSIYHEGAYYVGYMDSDGYAGITRFDPGTDTAFHMRLGTSTSREVDDHNNPGITVLPDNRLLAVYSKHNETQFYFRTSKITSPTQIGDWNDEQIHTLPSRNSYANTFRLSAESDAVYNFSRCLNLNPTLSISTNNGTGWGAPELFIQNGTGQVRPYPRYTSNREDRIDLIYTDGHPRDVDNSIYHLYYQAGAVYKTDGTLLKSMTNLPIQHASGERGTEVYTFSTNSWGAGEGPDDWIPNGRAWTWDIHYQTNAQPVCVFQVQLDMVTGPAWSDDRIYYYYARWTGTEWQRRFIAHGGRGIYQAEDDYGGGICIDPDHPGVVYLSSNAADPFDLASISNVTLNVNERYELYRGETLDGGLTFSWTAVTTNSPADNFRPVVTEGHRHADQLFWFTGNYNSYTSWDTEVVGKFGRREGIVPPPAEVLEVMERVNDFWMAGNPAYGNNRWANAAYYTGAMRLWEEFQDSVVWDYINGWGEKYNWTVYYRAADPTHADEQIAGQTYIDVFRHEGGTDTNKIVSIRDNVQIQMDRPAVDDWSWIDALYMSAPVFARLGNIYSNTNYYEKMYDMYRHTGYERDTGLTGVYGLFDPAENLWYRDSKYVYPKQASANGEKIFWARGNGWVFGSLVRVLNEIPADEPHRAEYELMFRNMAARLISIQKSDGYWAANLLDPLDPVNPETSGTAFFTYGLAWGVNNGLLDRATYEPHIARAWDGMVSNSVHASGLLGWVQPEDADPYNTWDVNTTRNYGVGAFLLAGVEIALMHQQGSLERVYANAGGNRRIADSDNNGFEPVMLDGSGSSSVNTTISTYNWFKNGAWISSAVSNEVALGLGTNELSLVVLSDSGVASTDTVNIVIVSLTDVADITASGWETPHVPENTLDNDFDTRWTTRRSDAWIAYELASTQTVQDVKIAFLPVYENSAWRKYKFDIQCSLDGIVWANVYTNGLSNGPSPDLETFDFPDIPARFVRILAKGNTRHNWNHYTEVEIGMALGTMNPDADNDGVGDWWEYDKLGGTGSNGEGDSDGDRISDRWEYIAGTDPKNPADFFQLEIVGTASGMELVWPRRPVEDPYYPGLARFYSVEAAPTVTGTWSVVIGQDRIPADGPSNSVPVILSTNTPMQFYRTATWLE